ncbi:uncharacterized protein BX664DRAFT_362733 [Halteromyces radiatus]|uniref:uncharacterized protein n=1 Tax=Halteromyces radiatus TaxID=101107 RepID=UPI002220BA7F|nr:uncharacterized protein BX664DRAFT_362733 [Halteromyces radiatus]KAI8076809.1 hypothetical protein BX664DRAFT_362733 [Halteromyces radiatus]
MMDDQQQTAPETTRGLFDPPGKVQMTTGDKRRSFNGLSERYSLPIQQQQQQQQRRPRSRSSVTAANTMDIGTRKSYNNNSFGLHTLPEEVANDRKKEGGSMTVDSLQDMINTLKTMPSSDTNRRKSVNRRLSSVMAPPKQHIQDEEDELSREAALAEAEAKLMGTYNRMSSSSQVDSNNSHLRQLGSRPFSSGGEDHRRLSSENLIVPSNSSSKRMSLQQLPTLNENVEDGNKNTNRNSRRIQFNKPLNLEEAKKQHRRSASYSSSLYANEATNSGWRSSAPPPNRHSTGNSSTPLNSSAMHSGSSLSVPSFNLVPFTPTRVNFSRDDANPHQRRQLFIAHLPFSALTPLFRSRQLVRGTLRVNKRNRSDAYVACEELDDDIYVCGSRDRNRALEGDVVAVRLVDVERVLREKKEKEEAKVVRNGGHARTRQPDEEDENEIIFGGDEDIDVVKPKYCGVVVAILERAQNQVFSGTLTLRRPNNKRAQEETQQQQENGNNNKLSEAPRIVWFKAVDKRVPLIAIPIEQAPTDFVEDSESYAERLFVSSIKRWPITSLHPFGTLERELGHIFKLDVQTMAILADNNVTHTDFSEQVNKCLPSMPYDFTPIPDDHRRDFTDIRVFTIDPSGSDVLDDALSIKKLGDDIYEVGVHISDVTYFIKANSPLDKEARARGVRVDLIHKSVPMLPISLTQQVTNLIPNQTRFAFSVVWKLDSDGKVLDTWFGKSVVKSCIKLTYDDAQRVLDGKGLEQTSMDQTLVSGIESDIRMLYKIASQLHTTRFTTGGSMSQQREELGFTFDHPVDNDHSIPSGVYIAQKPRASITVKEFLLLANQSVAQKISSHLPELALLRRQAKPLERKMVELGQYASRYLGVQLDTSSAHSLEKSIKAIEDDKVRKIVSVLVLKTMQPPKYFCTGVLDILKFSHYSLNMPLFTHFTAPSRRFADIIVHRQLESALANDRHFYLDRDTVQKLGQHCNVKKEAAIIAREQSGLLFMSLYLNERATTDETNNIKIVYREAQVIAVFDDYFDVMIPELNMERRIHLANLPVWRSEMDSSRRALTMFWKKGVDTSTGKQHRWSLSDDEYEDLLDEEWDDASDSAVVNKLSVSPSLVEPEPSKSSKRQSIIQARLSNSTSFSAEQSSQTIQALDKIRVILTIEMVRTPPLIRVLAANPYA